MLKYLKNTLKVVLVIAIITIIPPFYDAYTYFKAHPQKTYTYQDDDMPLELQEKLRLVKPVQNRILLALIILAAFILVDYKENPKDHVLNNIFEKLRRKP